MKKVVFRKKAAAAAVICLLAAGSITAYAAYRYLSPSEVAQRISDNRALAEAFESEDAIAVNETQTCNGYEITLLGLVSGEKLSPFVKNGEEVQTSVTTQDAAGITVWGDASAEQLRASQTYAAIAIARADGADMEYENKCVSPLIHGVDWMVANNATLDVGLHWFEQDGVIYELIECTNLEIFADRGVQIGIVDSFGDENAAFSMDSETGAYYKNEDYAGTNALFDLPLDQEKADSKAAEECLERIRELSESGEEASASDEQQFGEDEESYAECVRIMDGNMDAAEFLKSNAAAIPGTKQVLEMDKSGCVTYGDQEEEHGTVYVAGLTVGETRILSISSDGTPEGVRISTFVVNEDGTVTYEAYNLNAN
ncbi:MAG: DUF4179 domain-containing protein [Lachnospiraceae bacterium]|nr:DUF4179 domain-containing protein [Lachnospiraceae bacterium]